MKSSDTASSRAKASPVDGAAATGSSELNGGEPDVAELGARVEELREEAAALAETLNDTAQEMGDYVRYQATEQPYVALGVAAAAGFVLGGGLTPRVSAIILRTGGRLVANMLLREVIKPPSSI